MMFARFWAFASVSAPYPTAANWLTMPLGVILTLLIAFLLVPETAPGGGIETMFLSVGTALVFGDLVALLPSEEWSRNFGAA